VFSANSTRPIKQICICQARELRKSGSHYSINAGKDIREASQATAEPNTMEMADKTWKVRPSGLIDVWQLI